MVMRQQREHWYRIDRAAAKELVESGTAVRIAPASWRRLDAVTSGFPVTGSFDDEVAALALRFGCEACFYVLATRRNLPKLTRAYLVW